MEPKMRRKTFDTILTLGGVALTVVLIVAGALLMWGHNFAQSNVHSQLAQQQIFVPPAGSSALASPQIGPYMNRYAGQEVLSGPAAKAYADHFIGVHLSEMPYGGVYSKVSAAAMAAPKGSPQATQLDALKTTVFQGTTLRGLLLEAYAFWEFGLIALVASIASFALAGVTLVLSLLGFWHLRKVSPDEELLAKALHIETPVPASV
jgi:hypothetical protein